ncbi:conserved Plasmodium protein, unknown function [Plasmodium vinckei vinckei]|uniref:Uncharacterized protein n=1 Tax=Plasmodium vinckei vinckei TaxID=54757 RepID=A0A449BT59_PLAVN|nr:conserved Plasmodium protein, unknown function [Plasmodium vinckei vinckei]VEV56631.1 conserved Plasmodium protein, unknown function [Plasmodium vinckei vinckei]
MNTLSEYKRIKQAVFDKNKFNLKKKYIQNEKVRNNIVENVYNHCLYEVSKNNYKEKQDRGHNNIVRGLRNEFFDPVFRGHTNFSKENTSSIESLKNLRCTNESNNSDTTNDDRSERNVKRGCELVDEEYLDFSAQHRNNEKNATGIVKYEYCYICEIGKPCFCMDENYDNDKEIGDWHNTNIKSNVHSNLKDISYIMEKIQSTKKKQEETPINKKNNLTSNSPGKKKSEKKNSKKVLSIYERFYRDKIKIVKDKLSNLRNGTEVLDEELNMDYKSINDYEKDENFMIDRMEALKNMERKHLELLSVLLYEHKELADHIL